MRQPVDLPRAYRLLNHGPTVLVSAAHGGQRNLMTAAWAMALDFDPPKVAVVLDKSAYTRKLIEASGEFALQLPCAAQADLATTAGSHGGEALAEAGDDKFRAVGAATFAAERIAAPLVEGCLGWLECRLIREPHIQQAYDLFLGEVVAAQADARVYSHGRWHFPPDAPGLRTLHHVAGGAYLLAGDMVQGRDLGLRPAA